MNEPDLSNIQVKKRVCKYIKQGMFKKDAAVMAGISEATFYRWLDEDESFKSQVQANILKYKHSLIKIVNNCAVTDGRLALEVLKRRFPKDWDGSYDEKIEESKTTTQQVADLLQQIIQGRDDDDEEETPSQYVAAASI